MKSHAQYVFELQYVEQSTKLMISATCVCTRTYTCAYIYAYVHAGTEKNSELLRNWHHMHRVQCTALVDLTNGVAELHRSPSTRAAAA